MANYNMNSHWQTPVSDEKYKENYDNIFKKHKTESYKNTESGRKIRKEDQTDSSSNPVSKGEEE